MKSVGSLIAFSALTVVWASSGVQAAGIVQGSRAVAAAAVSAGIVEEAHGCHSHYARGIQGWHRHGADCALKRDLAEGRRRKKIWQHDIVRLLKNPERSFAQFLRSG